MAEEDQDMERRLRVADMVLEMQVATENKNLVEVQAAIGNLVALMAVRQGDASEEVLLSTLEIISEIYRGVRAHVRAGKEPGIFH